MMVMLWIQQSKQVYNIPINQILVPFVPQIYKYMTKNEGKKKKRKEKKAKKRNKIDT